MNEHARQTGPRTLKEWFLTPPRAHGDIIEGRVVSFLELFYDLVFVVLIAQIAHSLAGDLTWAGLRDFVVLFALIWIAWLNGSLYHELHGQEDGRSRSFIFIQMALLAVIAVYIGHAAEDPADGRGFAIVYALLLSVIATQWYSIRKYDEPRMAKLTMRYVLGLGLTIGLIAGSALVNDQGVRLAIWVGAVLLTVLGLAVQVFTRDPVVEETVRISESLAERFALFTIIVLGEVVVGVVQGMSEADHGVLPIATGMAALLVGFGFWWTYFDFAGQRPPKVGNVNQGLWNFAHFPMWLAIAGAGAGMASLVEHAGEAQTPTGTAWMVSGSTALMMLSLAVIARSIPFHPGGDFVLRTLPAGAVVAVLLGALRPSPLILALGLAAILSLVWTEAMVRKLRNSSSERSLERPKPSD